MCTPQRKRARKGPLGYKTLILTVAPLRNLSKHQASKTELTHTYFPAGRIFFSWFLMWLWFLLLFWVYSFERGVSEFFIFEISMMKSVFLSLYGHSDTHYGHAYSSVWCWYFPLRRNTLLAFCWYELMLIHFFSDNSCKLLEISLSFLLKDQWIISTTGESCNEFWLICNTPPLQHSLLMEFSIRLIFEL